MDNILKLLPWIVFLFLLAAALQVVVALQKKKGAGKKAYKFEGAGPLMSPGELKFFRVLEAAVGENYRLFSKVRLLDVVQPKQGLDKNARQSALNVVQSKHVDFVACDPNDMAIQFVVELDDKTHQRADRVERDLKVDDALEQAGIPIFHFPAKASYAVQDIQAKLFEPPPSGNGPRT